MFLYVCLSLHLLPYAVAVWVFTPSARFPSGVGRFPDWFIGVLYGRWAHVLCLWYFPHLCGLLFHSLWCLLRRRTFLCFTVVTFTIFSFTVNAFIGLRKVSFLVVWQDDILLGSETLTVSSFTLGSLTYRLLIFVCGVKANPAYSSFSFVDTPLFLLLLPDAWLLPPASIWPFTSPGKFSQYITLVILYWTKEKKNRMSLISYKIDFCLFWYSKLLKKKKSVVVLAGRVSTSSGKSSWLLWGLITTSRMRSSAPHAPGWLLFVCLVWILGTGQDPEDWVMDVPSTHLQ